MISIFINQDHHHDHKTVSHTALLLLISSKEEKKQVFNFANPTHCRRQHDNDHYHVPVHMHNKKLSQNLEQNKIRQVGILMLQHLYVLCTEH